MAKVISLTSITEQKRLALKAQLAEINSKIEEAEQLKKKLCSQRRTLEQELYTPREQAIINLKREAEKLTW